MTLIYWKYDAIAVSQGLKDLQLLL